MMTSPRKNRPTITAEHVAVLIGCLALAIIAFLIVAALELSASAEGTAWAEMAPQAMAEISTESV